MHHPRAARVLLLSSILFARTALADTAVEEAGDSPKIKAGDGFELGAILQARYEDAIPHGGDADTRAFEEQNDGWAIRRARFEAKFEPEKHVKGELYFDYIDANKKNASALKDAFIEVRPHKRIAITVGQFKVPFSVMHLRSVAHLEVAENGATDDLLVQQGFAGFDQGLMGTVKPLPKKKWLIASVGVFANQAHAQQATPAGLVAARVTSEIVPGLQLGAGIAWRPKTVGDPSMPDPKHPEADRYGGHAIGVDARFQYDWLHLQAEVVHGTRTEPWRGAAGTFLGATFLGSVDVPVCDMKIVPALKLEMVDDNLEYGVGRRLLGTVAASWWFRDDTRLLVEVEEVKTQAGSVREDAYSILDYVDSTLVLAQLQLDL